VVHAQHLDTGDFPDHRFHERPGGFEQMGPYLLEQISPLVGRERLDQMLFGRGQDALEPDHDNIVDQVRADILGSPAHVFLLEPTHPLADSGLDFPLCFHSDLESVPVAVGRPHYRPAPEGARPRIFRSRPLQDLS
jgi:hypothetical protein